MSFWSKLANIATGGISGGVKALQHGDIGGVFKAGAGWDPTYQKKVAAGTAPPTATPGAQNYLSSFAPAEQQRIQGTWAGNNNGLNDWFKNAQAAGVPGAQNNVSSPAPAVGGLGGAIARPGGSPIDPAAWSQALHEAQARVRPGGGGGGWARPSQPLQAPVMGAPAAPGQPPAGGGQDLAQRMDFARRRFQMMGGGGQQGGGGQVQ
jgi:hypothetical protein